jgi:hypothetical protein
MVQRYYLMHLNKKKAQIWDAMSPQEKIEYQTDVAAREQDGNKRLDFRFAY